MLAWSVDTQRYIGRKGARVAPGAFAVWSQDRDPEVVWCGRGYSNNSETLFAAGVTHILDDILMDEAAEPKSDEDNFRLDVFVKNSGTRTYLERHIPTWLAENGRNSGGKTPASYPTWKRIYLLSCFGKVVVHEATDPTAKRRLKDLSDLARADTLKTPTPGLEQPEGITGTRKLKWQE